MISGDFDSLRPTKTITPGSLMGCPVGAHHSSNRHAISKIKNEQAFCNMLVRVDPVAREMLQRWRGRRGSGDDGRNDEGERVARAGCLGFELQCWALDTMFLYLYDKRPETEEEKRDIIAAVDSFAGEVSRRTNQPIWMWLEPARIRSFTTGFGFLRDMALKCKDDDDAPLPGFMRQSAGMREWEINDELVLMLAASFESTAHTVAQCMLMLANDPERQSIAAKEARRTLEAAPEGRLSTKDIRGCKDVMHVLYEALRLHPTIPFSARKIHKCIQMEVPGPRGRAPTRIRIPAKCYLTYFKTAIGQNPRVFDNPLEFQPERYDHLRTREEKHAAFLPFGAGPRRCWGQELAEIQAGQLLIRMLAEFELFLPHTGSGEDKDEHGLPKKGVPASLDAVLTAHQAAKVLHDHVRARLQRRLHRSGGSCFRLQAKGRLQRKTSVASVSVAAPDVDMLAVVPRLWPGEEEMQMDAHAAAAKEGGGKKESEVARGRQERAKAAVNAAVKAEAAEAARVAAEEAAAAEAARIEAEKAASEEVERQAAAAAAAEEAAAEAAAAEATRAAAEAARTAAVAAEAARAAVEAAAAAEAARLNAARQSAQRSQDAATVADGIAPSQEDAQAAAEAKVAADAAWAKSAKVVAHTTTYNTQHTHTHTHTHTHARTHTHTTTHLALHF